MLNCGGSRVSVLSRGSTCGVALVAMAGMVNGGGDRGGLSTPFSKSPVRALVLDGRREGLLAVGRAGGQVECVAIGVADSVDDWEQAAHACGTLHRDGALSHWVEQLLAAR
jgi:hypothetical protein